MPLITRYGILHHQTRHGPTVNYREHTLNNILYNPSALYISRAEVLVARAKPPHSESPHASDARPHAVACASPPLP